MCMFCCGARGPHGLVCNDKVGHPGDEHVSFLGKFADEDSGLFIRWKTTVTEQAVVVAAWN